MTDRKSPLSLETRNVITAASVNKDLLSMAMVCLETSNHELEAAYVTPDQTRANSNIFDALRKIPLERLVPQYHTYANDVPDDHDEYFVMLKAEMRTALERIESAKLAILLINQVEDHNTEGTPKRVAKMLIEETWKGRYEDAPDITDFPNVSEMNDMQVIGPLRVESSCAHHQQSISGWAWIGSIPDKDVVGLSKFSRVLDHFARRPQIQEELTNQVADMVHRKSKAKATYVMINASHNCMKCRGVQEPASNTLTSVSKGTTGSESRSLFNDYVRMNPAPKF